MVEYPPLRLVLSLSTRALYRPIPPTEHNSDSATMGKPNSATGTLLPGRKSALSCLEANLLALAMTCGSCSTAPFTFKTWHPDSWPRQQLPLFGDVKQLDAAYVRLSDALKKIEAGA